MNINYAFYNNQVIVLVTLLYQQHGQSPVTMWHTLHIYMTVSAKPSDEDKVATRASSDMGLCLLPTTPSYSANLVNTRGH